MTPKKRNIVNMEKKKIIILGEGGQKHRNENGRN